MQSDLHHCTTNPANFRHIKTLSKGLFFSSAIPGMMERAYSVTPVRLSLYSSGISNLRLSFSGGASMSFGHISSFFKI